MNEYFFDYIDIQKKNIYILDGIFEMDDVEFYCEEYEWKIKYYGGIDIQFLGIGWMGYIGFNELGFWEIFVICMVCLDVLICWDVVKDFDWEEDIFYWAIIMGIQIIMEVCKIFLLGWGQYKVVIFQKVVEEEIMLNIFFIFL